MPKFNKTIDELESHYDKWLYVLKNLHKLDRLPENLKERVFERVFEVAEIAKFSHEEYLSYEDSLKYYRDLYKCSLLPKCSLIHKKVLR